MADTPPIVESSGLDIDAATTYLVAYAAAHSTRRCAHAVRSTLLAGGVVIQSYAGGSTAGHITMFSGTG